MPHTLPFIISNPHAGLSIPQEVVGQTQLTYVDIVKDSDEQAKVIYGSLKNLCYHYIEADIARAFVDLNRPDDDISKDGVVKTHTCYDVPIYQQRLCMTQVRELLSNYYQPYYRQLKQAIDIPSVKCLIDCHTMAAYAPPSAQSPGDERPLVCLSNAMNTSCPPSIFKAIETAFSDVFGDTLQINEPFQGGYICTYFGQFIPAVQLELSRTESVSVATKSRLVNQALTQFSQMLAD